MLIKQTFIVFIIAPCVFYAGYSLNCSEERECGCKFKIKNIIIALTVGVVLSSVFYWNNLVYESIASRAGFVGAVSGKNIFELKHLLYYPLSLWQTIGMFFILVFLVGLINLRKAEHLYRWLFLVWLLFPIVFLSFFSLKYAEYTISVLPAIALITSAGISALTRKRIRKGLITVMLVFSFAFYYQTICGFSSLFYSNWDIDKQYRLMVFKMRDTVNNDKLLIEDLIVKMGNSDMSIGICYDNTDLFFPMFLIKRIFSSTKINASIVVFSFNPTVFFKSIDSFDMLIYVTRSKKHWLRRESFAEFIDNFNKKSNVKIVFSDEFADDHIYADRKQISFACNLAEKLIRVKRGYNPYCYMRFMNESTGSYEHVYLYKRQD